ncbi:MAG TPA: SufD family Fe-S cluster assembly protein [Clostridia bacterium]|nr:SufD family Fe-S cluster assembly protein [Clostridia bacterium]
MKNDNKESKKNKTIDDTLLEAVADMHGIPTGAYNIRKNGEGGGRHSTENIIISSKTDKPGIDIHVAPFTKNETVHIPVIITHTGVNDVVYNDFYIGEGADVFIVAGCGIHNSGSSKTGHDGIHRFFLGKNSHIKYVENHYGEGEGSGERVLNPTTVVEQEEGSFCEMEMVQIKGVDSTLRETTVNLAARAKIVVTERLLTHGKQTARSNIDVYLNGEDSSAQIISRSVAQGDSEQIFYPRAVGNNNCRAHVQCDSIIMDRAKVRSVPEVAANHSEAQIVHEAAIGRINSEQLIKLQTFGMSEEQAEEVIIQGFLK